MWLSPERLAKAKPGKNTGFVLSGLRNLTAQGSQALFSTATMTSSYRGGGGGGGGGYKRADGVFDLINLKTADAEQR